MSTTAPIASTSRTRTATPTRAITSSLSARSSPAVPPPAHAYEPLVKGVLRQRLRTVFAYSAAFSWALAAAWVVWGSGGVEKLGVGGVLLALFRPVAVLFAIAGWAGGALPVVVLKKAFLTASRTSATSPSKTLQLAFAKPSTLRALLTYVASALFTLLIHNLIAYANEVNVRGDPRISPFVKSRKHPYYLNGRLVFLVFSQVTVAIAAFFRNILLDRFVFRWDIATSKAGKSPFRISHVLVTFFTVLLLQTLVLPFGALFFAINRNALPLLFKIPVLSNALRPFTAHFVRGSLTVLLPLYNIPLISRAWFLGFTTLASWEFVEVIFASFIAQPISVSHGTADPTVTLVSGISSSDLTFKFFAYSELQELASSETPAASSRRTALFGDQKYTPSLWNRLVRESLLLLGNDYQHLLRRGKAPVAAAPPPPPSAAPLPLAFPVTPARLIKQPIYQAPRQSPIKAALDSFAADGTFSQAVDASADAAHIPELFRSVEAIVAPTAAKIVAPLAPPKSANEVKGVVTQAKARAWDMGSKVAQAYAPAWAQGAVKQAAAWWRTERVSRVVDACLPARELDALVIDVLTQLTCASLTEDRYGVVQRDIPRILEALLSFLAAVEAYQAEVAALYVPPPADAPPAAGALQESEALRAEVARAGEVLGHVGDALKEGIARIVRTFGDRLLAYKFPPPTASKLQGFVDYC